MNIFIHPNFDKPGSLECTRRAIDKLVALGLTPMIGRHAFETLGKPAGCVCGEFSEMLHGCDLILPIGGDGTLLHAAQHALEADKPLLGINAGRVGFLAGIEANELDELSRLAEGRYTEQKRMMLEIELGEGEERTLHTALNDVILSRADSDRIVEISVSSEEGPVAVHRADGVIFSTPTGSTAYSLSAGGPIAAPGLALILMTAICPHASFNRSMILSPDRVYCAQELPGNNQRGLSVTVDGRRVGVANIGEKVGIRRSKRSVTFLNLHTRDFYARVDEKLTFRRERTL